MQSRKKYTTKKKGGKSRKTRKNVQKGGDGTKSGRQPHQPRVPHLPNAPLIKKATPQKRPISFENPTEKGSRLSLHLNGVPSEALTGRPKTSVDYKAMFNSIVNTVKQPNNNELAQLMRTRTNNNPSVRNAQARQSTLSPTDLALQMHKNNPELNTVFGFDGNLYVPEPAPIPKTYKKNELPPGIIPPTQKGLSQNFANIIGEHKSIRGNEPVPVLPIAAKTSERFRPPPNKLTMRDILSKSGIRNLSRPTTTYIVSRQVSDELLKLGYTVNNSNSKSTDKTVPSSVLLKYELESKTNPKLTLENFLNFRNLNTNPALAELRNKTHFNISRVSQEDLDNFRKDLEVNNKSTLRSYLVEIGKLDNTFDKEHEITKNGTKEFIINGIKLNHYNFDYDADSIFTKINEIYNTTKDKNTNNVKTVEKNKKIILDNIISSLKDNITRNNYNLLQTFEPNKQQQYKYDFSTIGGNILAYNNSTPGDAGRIKFATEMKKLKEKNFDITEIRTYLREVATTLKKPTDDKSTDLEKILQYDDSTLQKIFLGGYSTAELSFYQTLEDNLVRKITNKENVEAPKVNEITQVQPLDISNKVRSTLLDIKARSSKLKTTSKLTPDPDINKIQTKLLSIQKKLMSIQEKLQNKIKNSKQNITDFISNTNPDISRILSIIDKKYSNTINQTISDIKQKINIETNKQKLFKLVEQSINDEYANNINSLINEYSELVRPK
jgi:hypothetical protein